MVFLVQMVLPLVNGRMALSSTELCGGSRRPCGLERSFPSYTFDLRPFPFFDKRSTVFDLQKVVFFSSDDGTLDRALFFKDRSRQSGVGSRTCRSGEFVDHTPSPLLGSWAMAPMAFEWFVPLLDFFFFEMEIVTPPPIPGHLFFSF